MSNKFRHVKKSSTCKARCIYICASAGTDLSCQVQAACNGEFAGVSPLGSDKLCLALLKNRNLEQFLELGDMLALLDELYKSAKHWSAQKTHEVIRCALCGG